MRLDLVKTLSFAVLHFSVGFTVTFALTGSVAISTGVALIEPAVNTVVFFFHERAWQRFTASKARRAAVPAAAPGGGLGPAPNLPSLGSWGLAQGACAKPAE
ncbi:DUF2061 domain-containing protein [Pelagibius marinus]|uniref:DUF2061 domain-containing protein n=1 Tax=Pelagibius marinus TaxID=2762760 RepID=UPI001D048656|nr:DUF2061 domain-containing protein [Pelagibius marinus]